MNPFEEELSAAIKWEVLGVLQSMSADKIIEDQIIFAKLLEGTNSFSVVAQYDGELLALKVKKHIETDQ